MEKPKEEISVADRINSICPYCSARLLWQESEKVGPDPESPLKFSKTQKARQASHLLASAESLGIPPSSIPTIVTATVPIVYVATERRFSAPPGGLLRLINIFGRWLSTAVELYLLSVPVETHDSDLALSMYISAHNSSQGVNSTSKTTPGFAKAMVQTFRKLTLSVGVVLYVLLPDLVTSEGLDHDLS